jgi:hypothetical protein
MAIAILGAGILGTCTALELADRGHRVVLFERNAEVFSEASLYNEGKLHLGFVYAADPSFRTAEKMIRGAARFMDVLRRWVPEAELRLLPARPFDYVVHRRTMVPVAAVETHFGRVAEAMSELMHDSSKSALPYDASRPIWRRLSADDLSRHYNPDVIEAAYETCEIAVDPWAIAKHLRAAVASHSRIELMTGARVIAAEDRVGGGFDIRFDAGGLRSAGPFTAVVNALWANRPAIDQRYGLPPRGHWITRRKLGVNLPCAPGGVTLPSFTIMLGPFGDSVVYQSGRVYLSWYPSCMIGTTTGAEETDWNAILRNVDLAAIRHQTIAALAEICPRVRDLESMAEAKVVVNGGSIFALGRTDIDDPGSQLHERFDIGIDARGRYLSVDTSKFTLGPAMAIQTADRMTSLLGQPA